MILANVVFAVSVLGHTVSARVPRAERQAGEIVLPDLKSNFRKNNVSATWAPGHPKAWGTEDARYQLNITSSGPNSWAAVTPDEKYLALWDGNQVQFTDLDTNTVAASYTFELPRIYWSQEDLMIKSAPQGGYDILVLLTVYTLRQRITADLQPVGAVHTYEGAFASITAQGNLLTNIGNLYDLDNTLNNNTVGKLDTPMTSPFVSTYCVAPGRALLGFLDWDLTAKLVSAASGQEIATLGSVGYDGNGFDFSPDGKYIAVLVDSRKTGEIGRTRLRIFDLDNPAAAPVDLAAFNTPGGHVAWSPLSTHIAVSDEGRLQIIDFPSGQVTQSWEMEISETPAGLAWHDGGTKLSWSEYFGQYLYDFEKNLVHLWAPTTSDRSWKKNGFMYLKKRGLYVTEGGDNSVRFWKI